MATQRQARRKNIPAKYTEVFGNTRDKVGRHKGRTLFQNSEKASERVNSCKAPACIVLFSRTWQKGCQNSDNLFETIDTKRELASGAGVRHDLLAKIVAGRVSQRVKIDKPSPFIPWQEFACIVGIKQPLAERFVRILTKRLNTPTHLINRLWHAKGQENFLLPSEAVSIGMELEKLEREAARERQS